ncbi:PPE domain-containing protein [Actinophytocola oryzae]|uniref:PPE family protein n=1 Tax=Actinophytocola oryzae TaxID=502181 RepID=A0A4R7UZ99_9PSEU|nr:PPE domain-containing protein [Actinophytocola oryzae]TDV41507.1 PPE family protein [Actinophytocola oryzae]
MNNPAPPTDGTRWRGYSHKDLYAMLHDGPGAAASAEPSRRWAEVSATLTEIGQDLQKALDLTGGGWTGPAAGAAYDRLSTTVTWASATGTSAGAMRVSVEEQANHIAQARAEMPQPEDVPATQPDPTVAPAVQVLQAQTDAEAAEAAASSAEERAVEVMTAYETNTNATTGALATFDRPPSLLPNTDLHQGRGGGLLGLGLTAVSGLFGGGRHDDRHDDRRDNRGGRGGSGTHGSSAPWQDGPRRRSLPGPGRMSGASADPFLSPGPGTTGRPQESVPRRGNVVGANPGGGGGGSGSGVPGAPKSTGALPTHELQQAQQAAAASQAAAGTHPGAGAPMAPATGAPLGGQEKMAMRRFGMDAIGSSQWFGDTEEPVPGQAPKRRFDLRESAEVTESVSILDEEHQLPPNVIGEGGR